MFRYNAQKSTGANKRLSWRDFVNRVSANKAEKGKTGLC